MGGSVSKALGRIFGNKEMRILMLGLDAAGKTSILFYFSDAVTLKFFLFMINKFIINSYKIYKCNDSLPNR